MSSPEIVPVCCLEVFDNQSVQAAELRNEAVDELPLRAEAENRLTAKCGNFDAKPCKFHYSIHVGQCELIQKPLFAQYQKNFNADSKMENHILVSTQVCEICKDSSNVPYIPCMRQEAVCEWNTNNDDQSNVEPPVLATLVKPEQEFSMEMDECSHPNCCYRRIFIPFWIENIHKRTDAGIFETLDFDSGAAMDPKKQWFAVFHPDSLELIKKTPTFHEILSRLVFTAIERKFNVCTNTVDGEAVGESISPAGLFLPVDTACSCSGLSAESGKLSVVVKTQCDCSFLPAKWLPTKDGFMESCSTEICSQIGLAPPECGGVGMAEDIYYCFYATFLVDSEVSTSSAGSGDYDYCKNGSNSFDVNDDDNCLYCCSDLVQPNCLPCNCDTQLFEPEVQKTAIIRTPGISKEQSAAQRIDDNENEAGIASKTYDGDGDNVDEGSLDFYDCHDDAAIGDVGYNTEVMNDENNVILPHVWKLDQTETHVSIVMTLTEDPMVSDVAALGRELHFENNTILNTKYKGDGKPPPGLWFAQNFGNEFSNDEFNLANNCVRVDHFGANFTLRVPLASGRLACMVVESSNRRQKFSHQPADFDADSGDLNGSCDNHNVPNELLASSQKSAKISIDGRIVVALVRKADESTGLWQEVNVGKNADCMEKVYLRCGRILRLKRELQLDRMISEQTLASTVPQGAGRLRGDPNMAPVCQIRHVDGIAALISLHGARYTVGLHSFHKDIEDRIIMGRNIAAEEKRIADENAKLRSESSNSPTAAPPSPLQGVGMKRTRLHSIDENELDEESLARRCINDDGSRGVKFGLPIGSEESLLDEEVENGGGESEMRENLRRMTSDPQLSSPNRALRERAFSECSIAAPLGRALGSNSPSKGILKKPMSCSFFRSKSLSVSCYSTEQSHGGSSGSLGVCPDLESEIFCSMPESIGEVLEDENGFNSSTNSVKKSVRFSEKIQKSTFRPNSSILGQKKKNSRRNKAKAKKRGRSESSCTDEDADQSDVGQCEPSSDSESSSAASGGRYSDDHEEANSTQTGETNAEESSSDGSIFSDSLLAVNDPKSIDHQSIVQATNGIPPRDLNNSKDNVQLFNDGYSAPVVSVTNREEGPLEKVANENVATSSTNSASGFLIDQDCLNTNSLEDKPRQRNKSAAQSSPRSAVASNNLTAIKDFREVDIMNRGLSTQMCETKHESFHDLVNDAENVDEIRDSKGHLDPCKNGGTSTGPGGMMADAMARDASYKRLVNQQIEHENGDAGLPAVFGGLHNKEKQYHKYISGNVNTVHLNTISNNKRRNRRKRRSGAAKEADGGAGSETKDSLMNGKQMPEKMGRMPVSAGETTNVGGRLTRNASEIAAGLGLSVITSAELLEPLYISTDSGDELHHGVLEGGPRKKCVTSASKTDAGKDEMDSGKLLRMCRPNEESREFEKLMGGENFSSRRDTKNNNESESESNGEEEEERDRDPCRGGYASDQSANCSPEVKPDVVSGATRMLEQLSPFGEPVSTPISGKHKEYQLDDLVFNNSTHGTFQGNLGGGRRKKVRPHYQRYNSSGGGAEGGVGVSAGERNVLVSSSDSSKDSGVETEMVDPLEDDCEGFLGEQDMGLVERGDVIGLEA